MRRFNQSETELGFTRRGESSVARVRSQNSVADQPRSARRLVSLPHLPLSMIAAALGFADAERFSKWLKGQTGESPRQHRLSSRLEPRPPEESPTIQRFRRRLLGDLDPREAARWVRRLTAGGDGDEA